MRKGLTIALVLALMVPGLAAAQNVVKERVVVGSPGYGHGERGQFDCFDGPGRRGDRGIGLGKILALADELSLTDQQRDNLLKLQTDFQLEKIDRKAEVEKAEVRLRDLKRDDKASESDVFRAIDEVARLRAEMHKMAYRHRTQVHAELTEDQIKQLKEQPLQRMAEKRRPGEMDRPGRREMRHFGR